MNERGHARRHRLHVRTHVAREGGVDADENVERRRRTRAMGCEDADDDDATMRFDASDWCG